jgi:hypothetical protein
VHVARDGCRERLRANATRECTRERYEECDRSSVPGETKQNVCKLHGPMARPRPEKGNRDVSRRRFAPLERCGRTVKMVKTRDQYVENKRNARLYHGNALAYAIGEHRIWSDPEVVAGCVAERTRLTAEHSG